METEICSLAKSNTLRVKPHDMNVIVVDGNLLDQDVDVIVNAWNETSFRGSC